MVKVSEKLHKSVNGKCPKIKPGTLERVKLKTEVLLKDHLTVVSKAKIEPIEDAESEGEKGNKSAGLLIRSEFYIFSYYTRGHNVTVTCKVAVVVSISRPFWLLYVCTPTIYVTSSVLNDLPYSNEIVPVNIVKLLEVCQ